MLNQRTLEAVWGWGDAPTLNQETLWHLCHGVGLLGGFSVKSGFYINWKTIAPRFSDSLFLLPLELS